MKTGTRYALPGSMALAAVFALVACGPTADSSGTSPGSSTAVSEGAVADAGGKPASYAQCAACHAAEPGKHGIGPSLAGIVGRRAGSATGFIYSKAMADSGLIWDAATLDQYLTAPATTVRGTKMSYGGMANGAKRAELIEYLKTLK